MSPDDWQQVKELFHAALERAPADRAAFLLEACEGRDRIRLEVESLINSHEKSGSFISAPAYERAALLMAGENDALRAGQTLGHYRVIDLLGRGGMGEVYLAEDQRLGRKVVLKLLPQFYTQHADRLRRFEQEARAASALNHPNILTIYEIGQIDSSHFIVTEFISGQTLRQHIPAGGLKTGAALDLGIQIASALSAAHEAGIIHRDIKPENVMLRTDGIVKVLDFGLAKLAAVPAKSDPEARTHLKTDSGVIMGTAQYMSPEQARGLPVDVRTDIWSMGCVLYEMLAGRAPFRGETPSHTIVSILDERTPPLSLYRADVPAELEWIVMKALRKERDERYQTSKELLSDLKDLRQRLEFQAELDRSIVPASHSMSALKQPEDEKTEGFSGLPPAADTNEIEEARRTSLSREHLSKSIWRNWRWTAMALLIPLIAFAGGFALYKYFAARRVEPVSQQASSTSQPAAPLKGRQITSWSGLDVFPSFSPDGNSIAYSSDHNGSFEIYVKQLSPGGQEVQLTSDGQQNLQPVWSPDGQRIAFHANRRGGIWIMPSVGGAPKQLTDFGSRPAWSPDGSFIVFQSQSFFDPQINTPGIASPSTIWLIPVSGGSAKQLTMSGSPAGAHGAPCWSPDGRRIIFVSAQPGTLVGRLWSVAHDGGRLKPLTKEITGRGAIMDPAYAPDGKSIYYTAVSRGRNWNILKLPVSPETGDPVGEPVIIKDAGWNVYKYLKVSTDGKKLVHSAMEMTSNLWSISVTPATGEAKGEPVLLTRDTAFRKSSPVFSPDGKRIAYQKFTIGGDHNIWLMDPDGKNPTQLTTAPESEIFPSWFPQGDRVAYFIERSGQQSEMRWIDLQTRKDQLLIKLDQNMGFPKLSPDGKEIAFNSIQNGVTNIWVVALDGGEARQLTFGKDLTGFPHWSPDGAYIAFESKQGDSSHVMIIPREGGEARQLTSGTGESFTGGWSPDGNRISFAGYREGVWNLWWVARDGRAEKQVTNYTKLNGIVRYPAWSPLGNQLVYEFAEITGNIWIQDLE